MLNYLVLFLAILMSAFYSGSETGLYCVNRLKVWLRAERRRGARLLKKLASRPRWAISTILVGNNIANYLASVACTAELRQVGLRAPDLYSTLIMAPVLLVFGELTPKAVFQHNADRLMYKAVWPLRVSEVVFYPFSRVLHWLGELPRVLLGRQRPRHAPDVTPRSVRFYLSRGADQGVLSPYQQSMAENILRLREMPIESALTSLEDVVMVPEEASYAELRDTLAGHRYSRVPVFRDRRSDIVGVINVIDVASVEPGTPPTELVRDVPFLSPETSVGEALTLFREEKQQFGVVADEEGRAVGVITVKDLVEEIVGELEAW
ncbi:MAG: CNNM domain-containing protein [Candidatus Brocadiia bacterium]